MSSNRQKPYLNKVTAGLGAVILALSAVVVVLVTKPSAPIGGVQGIHASAITCSGDITSTLQAAVNSGGAVSVSAGTCTLTTKIAVKKANTTITGAGPTSTFLVQKSTMDNIFQITAAGVTINGFHLDTSASKATPPSAVLFSNASNTTIENMTGITANVNGGGFGMRLTGPNPCSSDQVTGDVVTNVTMTSFGTGGFSGIDVDCNKSFTVSNITITGGSLTPFQDATGTINGMTYTQGPLAMACEPDIEVTGPSTSIAISNVVTSAGTTRLIANPKGVTIVNETETSGDPC